MSDRLQPSDQVTQWAGILNGALQYPIYKRFPPFKQRQVVGGGQNACDINYKRERTSCNTLNIHSPRQLEMKCDSREERVRVDTRVGAKK